MVEAARPDQQLNGACSYYTPCVEDSRVVGYYALASGAVADESSTWPVPTEHA